jgi:hypothetical protein
VYGLASAGTVRSGTGLSHTLWRGRLHSETDLYYPRLETRRVMLHAECEDGVPVQSVEQIWRNLSQAKGGGYE